MTKVTLEQLDGMYHPVYEAIEKIKADLVAQKIEIPAIEVLNKVIGMLEENGTIKGNEDYILIGAMFYQIMDFHQKQTVLEELKEEVESMAFMKGFGGKVHKS